MGIGSNTLLEGDGLLFVDRLGLVGTDGRVDGMLTPLSGMPPSSTASR